MPSIIIERQECKKEMWDALKRHIVRSRQKKKEELEEEEAEERQRKLREEQYQKERMTLEETRSQLRSLESHLAKCRDEKHELFLQLKKVLHESESRRAAKAELRTQLFPQQPNVQTHNIQAYAPPRQYIKAGYGGEMIPSQEVTEDGRRGLNEHGGRAVLWNKSQYSTAAQRFYPTPHPSAIHSAHVISTVTHHVVPQAQAAAPPPTSVAAPPPSAITTTEREREREREQREQRERERDQRDQREREREREAPPASKPGPVHASFTPQPRPQTHTQYQDKFYSVRPATHVQPATHVPIHGGAIPIQQSPQNAKTGSITSGYPVRSPAPPTVSQHASPHASPQPPTRPTFQPAGPIINALPVVGVGPAGLTRQAVLTESASALSRSHDTSRPSPQAIFAPHRLIPITSASTSMGQLPSHPVPGGHGAAGHGPPHSSSHASHPSSHALSHPHHGTHPHPGSHSSSHPPAHVSHGTHPHSQPQPIPSLGHPSVLHTTHQQVLQVSVSQSHQGHQGPPGRFTMSSMPRES